MDAKKTTPHVGLEASSSLIELSRAQVDGVVRGMSGGGVFPVLMARLGDVSVWFEGSPAEVADRRFSRSLLSGLKVLACSPTDGTYLSATEVADRCGMNMSTAHRYISTLVALGLLERDPATRRYRVVRFDLESQSGALSRETRAAEPGAGVVVALSREQVEQVVRDAAGAGAMSILFCGREDVRAMLEADPEVFENSRLSHSLIYGLLMLAMFPLDGGDLGNAELARLLGANPSTTHRYVSTLVTVGVLEHLAETARYRLVL
jgi:DNA-binding MarR family transcriptional regulator